MITERITLESWKAFPEQNRVELTYIDGDKLYVTKTDFDRAFGPIISSTKEEIDRDFAIKV